MPYSIRNDILTNKPKKLLIMEIHVKNVKYEAEKMYPYSY